jgi:hypothetical protein
VISFAYFADMFGILNWLNISLRDTEVTILKAEGKVQSCLGKKGEVRHFFKNDSFFAQIALNSVPPVESKVHVIVITT